VWTCSNKRGYEHDCLGDLNDEPFPAIWSRRTIPQVNEKCRVMCRGHLANRELHKLYQLKEHPHINFI
jgi:hypothetical protein